jgi:hypothetical protein
MVRELYVESNKNLADFRESEKTMQNGKHHTTTTHKEITYSTARVLLDNVPYIVTVILGALIVRHSWNILPAIAFAIYGAVGTLWFIVFICPHCNFYGTKACPCGYGSISALFVRKRDSDQFEKIFKKNVPVIFPIWIVPVVAGVNGMARSFSPAMLILLVVFMVISYAVLPLLSKKHGCLNCPNRERCPWMGKENMKTIKTSTPLV